MVEDHSTAEEATETHENNYQRRSVLGGLGAAFAAASVLPDSIVDPNNNSSDTSAAGVGAGANSTGENQSQEQEQAPAMGGQLPPVASPDIDRLYCREEDPADEVELGVRYLWINPATGEMEVATGEQEQGAGGAQEQTSPVGSTQTDVPGDETYNTSNGQNQQYGSNTTSPISAPHSDNNATTAGSAANESKASNESDNNSIF